MNKAILKTYKTLFLIRIYKYTILKRYCNIKQINTI